MGAVVRGHLGFEKENVTIHQHSSAMLDSNGRYETLKSVLDSKESACMSKVALVLHKGQTRLALLNRFLRASDGNNTIFRVALCDIYHNCPTQDDSDCGEVYAFRKYVVRGQGTHTQDSVPEDFEDRNVLLDLGGVITKVSCYVRPTELNEMSDSGFYWVYCATSLSRSGQTTCVL